MNKFWNNISRYPRFFISSVAGSLLIANIGNHQTASSYTVTVETKKNVYCYIKTGNNQPGKKPSPGIRNFLILFHRSHLLQHCLSVPGIIAGVFPKISYLRKKFRNE